MKCICGLETVPYKLKKRGDLGIIGQICPECRAGYITAPISVILKLAEVAAEDLEIDLVGEIDAKRLALFRAWKTPKLSNETKN